LVSVAAKEMVKTTVGSSELSEEILAQGELPVPLEEATAREQARILS